MKLTEIKDVVEAVAASQDGSPNIIMRHISPDDGTLNVGSGANKDPLSYYIARSLCQAANDNSTRVDAIDRFQTDMRYAISQLQNALEASKAAVPA